ncbi:MAG: DUF4140 domain-containing protein, partial [Erysipelotrichaceae bacterium]|nr:DUF4140 domain-containing protein [Erysipelotrichaceae bacterium]
MPELFTSIESVNIFRNGAEVTRKGKTELKEGIQTVRVHGLSLTARQDSARLFSLPGIQCSNLRFEKADPDDPDLTSNRIQKEIDLLGRQIEVKELQVSLWQTNGDFSGRDNAGVEDVEKYIEKLPERLVGLHQELIDLKEKLRDLEKKYSDAQTEDSTPLMVADVSTDKAGEYPFELRYHEERAGW